MVERSRTISLVVMALTWGLVLAEAPLAIRLPYVFAAMIVAPGLALARLLPGSRSLDVVVIATMFGMSILVIASTGLAVAQILSGTTALLVVSSVVVVLSLMPSRLRPRSVENHDARSPTRLRVIWPDGQICCEVRIEDSSATKSDFTFGQRPAVRQSGPALATRPEIVTDDASILGRAVVKLVPANHGRSSTIDIERIPIMTASPTALYLWLDSERGKPRFGPAAVDRWIGRSDLSFGISPNDDLLAIRLEESP